MNGHFPSENVALDAFFVAHKRINEKIQALAPTRTQALSPGVGPARNTVRIDAF